MILNAGVPLDAGTMDSQLQQLKSLNQMVTQVLLDTAPNKRSEIEDAVRSQVILSPEQAKEWGIVQAIRTDFMEPGATLIAVEIPSSPSSVTPDVPFRFSSITPTDARAVVKLN
jgi:hypothetical protein